MKRKPRRSTKKSGVRKLTPARTRAAIARRQAAEDMRLVEYLTTEETPPCPI